MTPVKPVSQSTKSGSNPGRLSREQWLELSMQLLGEYGVTELTIDKLTAHLGVTKGSFYWHFKTHSQFLQQLTRKWLEDYTLVMAEIIADLDLPPRDKLREAMRLLIDLGRGDLDMNFRHLAGIYAELKEQIQVADQLRFEGVKGLFEGLGFTGNELRMRTHAFVVLHSLENGIYVKMSKKERLALLDQRLALFAGE